MTAEIIDLGKLRASGAPEPPQAEPAEDRANLYHYSDEDRQRDYDLQMRFRQHRALAEAGDTAALEKIAEYAIGRYEEAREVVNLLRRARQDASGEGREKYTAPDPGRSWDVAGFSGVTVSRDIEQHLEHVLLLLVANQPDTTLTVINSTHHVLKSALNRRDERRRQAMRRERTERKAARDREGLERQKRRIERELAKMGPPPAAG